MQEMSYSECFKHCKNLIKNHQYEEAMTLSHKLLDLYEKNQPEVPLKDVFEGIEGFFLNVPNGILHFTYLNRLAKLYEKQGLFNDQLKTMYDIAYDYIDAMEFTLAKSILNRGLKKARQYGYSDRESDFLNGLGRIYNEKKDYVKGLGYYKVAYHKALEVGYEKGKRIAHNIGYTLGRLKRYDEALYYFNVTIKYMCEDDNPSYCANTYNEIGYIYIKLKKYKQAEDALKKAYELSMKSGSYFFLSENYEFFAMLYEAIGHYSKALEYYKVFHEQHEKISKEKNKQVLKNYAYQKTLEKKDQEKESIRLKNIELDHYAKELDLTNKALEDSIKALSALEVEATKNKLALDAHHIEIEKLKESKDKFSHLEKDIKSLFEMFDVLKAEYKKNKDISYTLSLMDMALFKAKKRLHQLNNNFF